MSKPKAVTIQTLRQNLVAFLGAAERGEEFIVMSRRRPVARIGPPLAEPRPFGLLKGRIEMAPDFDETPPDIVDAMEGGVLP